MQPEERRASHILIEAKTPADKEKAKLKADEVLKEVQASPAKFADLAKKYSQDTGSAANGGDLEFLRSRHDGQTLRRRRVQVEWKARSRMWSSPTSATTSSS